MIIWIFSFLLLIFVWLRRIAFRPVPANRVAKSPANDNTDLPPFHASLTYEQIEQRRRNSPAMVLHVIDVAAST